MTNKYAPGMQSGQTTCAVVVRSCHMWSAFRETHTVYHSQKHCVGFSICHLDVCTVWYETRLEWE